MQMPERHIVGDAAIQQLSLDFTFDETHQDKLIVNLIADHVHYQLQLFPDPNIQFEEFKNSLLSKQFKLLQKTPDLIKIKIGFTPFQFKNVQKTSLSAMKQTIDALLIQMKKVSNENQLLKQKDRLRQTQFHQLMEKMERIQPSPEKKQKKDDLLIRMHNIKYTFSPQHKAKAITLSNNNTNTHPKQGCPLNCLALVEGAVFRKGSSIRFKIQTIGYVVGVGLTLRNVVAANSYRMKNGILIGHGCFILIDDGWSYSHNSKEQNFVKTEFKYGKGDVIGVETNEDELLFVNETKKREHRMKLNLTDDEWGQVCFCVCLSINKDSVSIA